MSIPATRFSLILMTSGVICGVAGPAALSPAQDCADYADTFPEPWPLVSGVTTPGAAEGVDVLGPTAYVACGDAGLQAINIATPDVPFIIGSLDTPGLAGDVAAIEGYAFVADGTDGLLIIDTSQVWSLAALGNFNTPGDARGVAAVGTH
jgi:hypothetical protein